VFEATILDVGTSITGSPSVRPFMRSSLFARSSSDAPSHQLHRAKENVRRTLKKERRTCYKFKPSIMGASTTFGGSTLVSCRSDLFVRLRRRLSGLASSSDPDVLSIFTMWVET
jgi:hypothetical protein